MRSHLKPEPSFWMPLGNAMALTRKRVTLSEAVNSFPEFRLPIEWQRIDSVLSLVVSHRKKKRADFIDLEKLASLAEAGVKQDPKRIIGTPFLY